MSAPFRKMLPWIALFVLVSCTSQSPTRPAPTASIPATKPSKPQAPVVEGPSTGPSPTDADPKDIVPFLASDELQGRGIGTPGLDRAADYIAAEFAADGLKPLPGLTDFFQPFDYVAQTKPGPATYLAIGSRRLKIDADYLPMRFSLEQAFHGPAVFVGYGVTAPEVGYDDYDGIDVKGKVVIAMRYEPTNSHGQSAFDTHGDPSGWSDHATYSTKAKGRR